MTNPIVARQHCTAKPLFKHLAIFGIILFPTFGAIGWACKDGMELLGAFFFAFSLLYWWMLYEALARYEWDEEVIIRRTIFGRQTMRWADIQGFRIRRILDGFYYILQGTAGKKLKVNIQMIGVDCPLFAILQEKLAPLMERSLSGIHPEASQKFPCRILGLKNGEIRLEPDRLSGITPFARKSIRYDEIRYVYPSAFYRLGCGKGRESQIFSDGRRNLLSIPSTCKDYDRLIFYLRHQLKSATWLDMKPNTPFPNQDEELAFHRYWLTIYTRQLWIFIMLWLITATGMVFYIIHHRHHHGSGGAGFVGALAVLGPYCLNLKKLRANRKDQISRITVNS